MEADDLTNDWVDSVIQSNRHINFVDRIARPELYPTLDKGNGVSATHLMSWSTMGKDQIPIVYPNVIFDPNTRKLKELTPDEAFQYAVVSGEYIPFATERAADTFSREYKRHWRNGKNPDYHGDAPPGLINKPGGSK